MTSATARTLGLAAAMITLSLGALVLVGNGAADPNALVVSWWMLAMAFAASEVTVFHLEFREEAHSFSFSQVPLVLGLFFASPAAVIVGRLVGSTLVLISTARQSALKLTFNVVLFVSECATALLVYHVLFDSPSLVSPAGWVAALAGVAAADALSAAAVSLVIRWHAGAARLVDVLLAATGSAAANGSLATVAALLAVYNPAALALLMVLAAMLFIAYRGYAGLSQRYANLNLLYDFTDAVGSADDSADVMGVILAHARDLLRAEVSEIVILPDATSRAIRLVGTEREPASPVEPPEGLMALLSDTIAQGHSVLAARGTRNPVAQGLLRVLSVRDGLLVPLQIDGRVIGAIAVCNRLTEISTFDDDDRRLFEALANHASIALDNGRLIAQLQAEVARREYQALHDALTGLPNRQKFSESCDAAIDDTPVGKLVGVLLMDVDQFKDINDTLGHQTGDEILQELGRRLLTHVAPEALVARLGGDEFAVLVTHCERVEQMEAEAQRLRSCLAEPITVQSLELAVEVSVGLAIHPDHGDDALALLQRADVAMYAAKTTHSGLQAYSSDHDPNAARRLWVASALRQALIDEVLDVHFQPKADLRDGRIIGAEALVRWTDPQRGPISPGEFIPVAERTELITPLTEFVLSESVAQCRRWRDGGHDLSISVNIAARSLMDPGLFDLVVDLMRSADLPFDRLVLELTETGIMTDTVRSIDALDRFAEAGVRLSVDDFGTGYSSLSYLQRLPVHEVKIDRGFVFNVGTDDSDAAIVRSIINLGHSLGLQVVAEGVENQLTVDRLARLGCDMVQGYFLSRPIAASQFSTWLADRQATGLPADHVVTYSRSVT